MANERIVSGAAREEDRGSEGGLRPRRLAEYIGQERVKETLTISMDAALQRGEPLDHVLLYGPPGLGKTTLASIIAAEMSANLRTTAGPAIERPGDMASLLTQLKPGDVLFIDEIHRLSKLVEEILYPGDGGLLALVGDGEGAAGAEHQPEGGAVHARRCDDALLDAERPAARPFRLGVPPRLLRRGRDAGHRAALGAHHGAGDRRGGGGRGRQACAGNASRGEPAAAPGAGLRAGARRRAASRKTWRRRRSDSWRWTRWGSTRSTIGSCG